MKGTLAALPPGTTKPVRVCPGDAAPAPSTRPTQSLIELPAGTAKEVPLRLKTFEGPALTIVPDAAPEFWIVILHSATVPAWKVPCPVAPVAHLTELATIEYVAGLADEPNMPNTKVAIATAAMRVMAMRMTVASTGEMAFLFFL